jgi:hypothetical protein
MCFLLLLLLLSRIWVINGDRLDTFDTVVRDAKSPHAIGENLIKANPANAGAMLMLAHLHEQESGAVRAGPFFERAFLLAPRDKIVMSEVALARIRQMRWNEGLDLLGKMVDLYPLTQETAFRAMTILYADAPHLAAWKQFVAEKPEWLGSFIYEACMRIEDPVAMLPMVIERIRSGQFIDKEVNCVIERLKFSGEWRQAYQLWLNVIPKARLDAVGSIFNGGFEFPTTGRHFDWQLPVEDASIVGYQADFRPVAGASGQSAMRVEYSGRAQLGVPVAQHLSLLPGKYQLSGRAMVESRALGRGALWAVRCMNKGESTLPPLATTATFSDPSPWHDFSAELTVPPADCPGQVLRLEAVSGQLLRQVLWFDDLRLRRLD